MTVDEPCEKVLHLLPDAGAFDGQPGGRVAVLEKILPKTVTNEYRGSKMALYVLAVIAALSITRSFIHILSPDGGAHSIAGIDIAVAGGATIVGMFAQWGLEQLLMAFVQLIVLVRYKSLVPLMYVFVFVEYAGREAVGLWKPLGTHHAPGVVGDYIMIPLSVAMFFLAVRSSMRRRPQ